MKKLIISIVLISIVAVSYWLISPLFINKEVQDTLDPELQARLEAQRKVDAARKQQVPTEETTPSNDELKPNPDATESVDKFGTRSTGPFKITGTSGHPAEGAVQIIESPEEKLVYFQDYDGTNGPDLKVYLSKDLEAKEIFDLGDAKGNQGNLIYGVPLNVNFDDYKYVLTWCEAFGVLFDYAVIN